MDKDTLRAIEIVRDVLLRLTLRATGFIGIGDKINELDKIINDNKE